MRFPLVIVEGCDGSGKTTLIRAIEKVPNIPQILRIHRSRRPKTESEIEVECEGIRQLIGPQRYGLSLPVVMDRHALISEPIYGTIVRDKPVTYWDGDNVPPFLLSPNLLIVYCRPSNEAVKTGIQNNPQMEGVIPKVDELLMAYDLRMSLLKSRGANVGTYNYQTDSALELWQGVYGV